MNSAVLGARRKVYPTESAACRVPGWYLNFDVEGVPYSEPCFASIGREPWKGSPDPRAELQAVVHKITPSDFIRIQRTEGGGGYAGLGYEAVHVQVELLDGRQLDAITLLHISRASGFYANPSIRYINLIVNGAREYHLSAEYISFLEAIPVYERPKLALWTLKLLFCVGPFLVFVASPVLIVYFLAKLLSAGGDMQAPRIVHVALFKVIDICYILHNYVWVHVTGNGYYNKKCIHDKNFDTNSSDLKKKL